tara:strand:+ start:76 stop:480 length:405 start_codon:yes stop_codon:yes gene_type:complete
MSTYSDKLRHPKWQKRRLEIMQRDEFTCQKCFAMETPLTVHHKYYTKGNEPWQYDGSALITLCEDCHEWMHRTFDPIKTATQKREFLIKDTVDSMNFAISLDILEGIELLAKKIIDLAAMTESEVLIAFENHKY